MAMENDKDFLYYMLRGAHIALNCVIDKIESDLENTNLSGIKTYCENMCGFCNAIANSEISN